MIGRWLQTLTALPPAADVLLKLTAILALGWAAHFLLRRRNPRWRVALWRGVAAGLLLAPAVALLAPAIRIAVERPVAAPVESLAEGFTEAAAPEPAPEARRSAPTPEQPATAPSIERSPGVDWLGWMRGHGWPVLAAVWGSIAAALALRVGRAFGAVRRILKNSTNAPEPAREILEALAARLGCRRGVALRVSPLAPAPFLCGAFRPVIVLPEAMAGPDYREELPAILAHELAHTRSRDLPWGNALHALQIVLWFHPLVWRMRAAHAAACEAVCDAVAAGAVGDVLSYSGTLARVALEAHGAGLAALGGIPMARTADVRRRIEFLKKRLYTMAFRICVVGRRCFHLITSIPFQKKDQ